MQPAFLRHSPHALHSGSDALPPNIGLCPVRPADMLSPARLSTVASPLGTQTASLSSQPDKVLTASGIFLLRKHRNATGLLDSATSVENGIKFPRLKGLDCINGKDKSPGRRV
jgi:hypothetical protein